MFKSRFPHFGVPMNIRYIFPLIALAAFVFIVFYAYGQMPHTLEAYTSPFTGENATASIVLLTLGLLDLILLNMKLIPTSLEYRRAHSSALTFTLPFAIFGLLIAVINENPWVLLPFIAVSLGNYILVYLKILEKQKIV